MEEIKVLCDSEITIINLKTGYIYKNEEEAQDILQDSFIKIFTINSKSWK